MLNPVVVNGGKKAGRICLAERSYQANIRECPPTGLSAIRARNSPISPYYSPSSEAGKEKGFKRPQPLETLDIKVEPGIGLEPATC
jgi:hypothetical protein